MGFIFLSVSWNLGYGQILIIEMFLSILIWLVLRIWSFLVYPYMGNFRGTMRRKPGFSFLRVILMGSFSVLHSNLQFLTVSGISGYGQF